ncbi:glycosyltransferase family 2 protein [Ignavibacterium sp.]|uniref:glycosyltransferase family 2 protein n=1 Tax=Ignavibacterium sp. TaxID=2651167 RepID=UPI00307F21B1
MNNSKRKINIAAVIPFFNESEFVREIVYTTLNFTDFVIAVDDGSTDNSAEKIKDLENVFIIKNAKNFGKGYSLKNGFEKAVELNAEYVVTLDADGQHKPELIQSFLEKISYCDIVIGNRMKDVKNMPMQRILSNKITSYLLSKKLGVSILDSQCGFRIYRRIVLENIRTKFNGFEAESEILVEAARKNFRIEFIDIPTVYENQNSKMKPFQAIKGFIKVLMM